MRILTSLLLLTTLIAGRATGQAEELRGHWICEAATNDALPVPAEATSGMRLTIIDEGYYLLVNGVILRSRLSTSRPEKGPSEIDLSLQDARVGTTVRGIYEQRGDKLRLCYSEVGAKRPDTFEPQRSSRTFVWRRATEGDAASLPGVLEGPFGSSFILVPPGTCLLGPATNEPSRNDERRRRATLSQPFYMQTHEVTVSAFRAYAAERLSQEPGWQTEAESGTAGIQDGRPGGFTISMGAQVGWLDGVSWRNPGWAQGDNHPVAVISWNDAVEYAKWLSKKDGRNYRLPTEAEWEYACRAGSNARYWWGDSTDNAVVANLADASFRKAFPALLYEWNFDDGYPFTSPVGSFSPNAFGLYDMHGNVWEWVSDRWGPSPSTAAVDPSGPTEGDERVAKGGAWGSRQDRVRAAYRFHDQPSTRFTGTGLRLVLDPN